MNWKRLLFLSVFLHFLVVSTNAFASSNWKEEYPESGEALYHFNESSGQVAEDSSSYSRDAEVVGTASFVPGEFGNGLLLDGKTVMVIAPARTTFPRIVDKLTIELWVKPLDYSINYVTLTERDGYVVLSFDTEGILTGMIFDHKNIYVTAPKPLPLNEWSHVALTYKGESGGCELLLYFNGGVVAKTILPPNSGLNSGIWASEGTFCFGNSRLFPGRYFHGVIDEVRISYDTLTFNSQVSPAKNTEGSQK